MQKSFWDARWREGKIGFHLKEVNPGLIKHWPALVAGCEDLQAPAPGRVLVPLCGKTHDLAWLANRGHEVVGVEFVESAARAFFEEQELSAVREVHRGAVRLRAPGISIYVSDVFDIYALDLPPFQWVYDRAALVAVEPPRREEYTAVISGACRENAGMLLLSFEHDMDSGPPFSVPEAEVVATYGQHFRLRQVADQDILDAESRFRDRGASFMKEQFYLATKRSTTAGTK